MNERQLLALKYVITHGTTTQAADLLNVTQPAISRMLSSLEHDLGVKLFERQRGRITPTPQAGYFLGAAEKILDAIWDARRRADTIRNLSVGDLKVASMPGFAITTLPRLVSDFETRHPNVRISLEARTSPQVRELVGSQAFDVGLAEPPWPIETFLVEPYAARCVCLLRRDDPLAEKDEVTPRDLVGRKLASLYASHLLTSRLRDAMAEIGADCVPTFECNLFPIAAQIVERTDAVAIVDPALIGSGFLAGLTTRPFTPPMYMDFAILRSRHKPSTPQIDEFTDDLRRALAAFAEPKPPQG
ncbi:MAG: LysR family transcriptional regulator [Rhodobacterales bacterium]|nr:LysR family transcriptional regulator [Rhodobacterales bacterium]